MRTISLRKLREDIGLKAYKVAEKLGISKRQLIRIENGQVKTVDNLKDKFADIYGVSVEVIEKAWEGSRSGQGYKLWKRLFEVFRRNKEANKCSI